MLMTARLLPQRVQRGLSLVEMMVGITIGLFVVAAASMVVTTQLRENKQLLVETQLQQDLRATADIIARDIRRAGYTVEAQQAVWSAAASAPLASPYQQVDVVAGTQGSVLYNYQRPDLSSGPFGYWVESGVVRVRLSGPTVPQDLSDRNVLYVEELRVEQQVSNRIRLECPNECPPDPAQPANYCWPEVEVRDITVTIRGYARSDPTVIRTVSSRVRLRNDHVLLNAGTPAAGPVPAAPKACPD